MGKNSSRRRGQDRPWRYERRGEPEIAELTLARAARREQAAGQHGHTPPQPPPAPIRNTGAVSSSNEAPAVSSTRMCPVDNLPTPGLEASSVGGEVDNADVLKGDYMRFRV